MSNCAGHSGYKDEDNLLLALKNAHSDVVSDG